MTPEDLTSQFRANIDSFCNCEGCQQRRKDKGVPQPTDEERYKVQQEMIDSGNPFERALARNARGIDERNGKNFDALEALLELILKAPLSPQPSPLQADPFIGRQWPAPFSNLPGSVPAPFAVPGVQAVPPVKPKTAGEKFADLLDAMFKIVEELDAYDMDTTDLKLMKCALAQVRIYWESNHDDEDDRTPDVNNGEVPGPNAW